MISELNGEDRKFLGANGIQDSRTDGSDVYLRTPSSPELYLMLNTPDLVELAAIGSLILHDYREQMKSQQPENDSRYFPPGGFDYEP